MARQLIHTLLLLSFVFCGAAHAGEVPPVGVDVYYSKKDPRWKDTEKVIDTVGRELPQILFNKTSIDDEAGYIKLSAAEAERPGMVTGDVTVIIGPYVLTSRGDRRDVEKYLGSIMHRVLNPMAGKGRKQPDVIAYAAELFGKTVKIDTVILEAGVKDPLLDAEFYRITDNGNHVAWIANVYWPIACPICNDTQFLVALIPQTLKILDVRPVRELELSGREMLKKDTESFIGQFKGADATKGISRVDIIAGATKTSLSYQGGLNKVLETLRKLEHKK